MLLLSVLLLVLCCALLAPPSKEEVRAVKNAWKLGKKGTKVIERGNTAIVTGKVDLHQNAGGKRTTTNLSVLSVWVKGPRGWQMIARQATRPTQ